MEPAGHLVRHFEALTGSGGVIGRGDRQSTRQGASLGGRRKRGAFEQAIGRSRGGRTTKIHALTDAAGRPRVLPLAGNVHDHDGARPCIAGRPDRRLLADRAYDANRLRGCLAERGIEAVIPSNARRKPPIRRTPRSIASATSSSACSAGSKTSDASPPDTTSSPETSSRASSSPPQRSGGPN